MAPQGLVYPMRVFLSHTSELSREPPSPSFVQKAMEAIQRAGHVPADMSLWSAVDLPTRETSEQRVRACDVYVAILGFRYGTLVRGERGKSYVEIELEAATAAGIPRLIFVLDDELDVPVPHSFHVDDNSARQENFKSRILDSSMTHVLVSSPMDLSQKLYQALIELNMHSAAPRRMRTLHTPRMVPPVLDFIVPRDELMSKLVAALLAEESQTIALTTALQGAGGFGKTTLASEVCRRHDILRRFPDGILWTTIGESVAGADLAGKLNDLSEALSGERPTYADPEQAGFHFGELLGAERRLLVIDDVWRVAQLAPFLFGGVGCVRLITTRNQSIIPKRASAITVDAMAFHEARALLMSGLDDLGGNVVDSLIKQTGRWPVLIGLVNGALRRYVRNGLSVDIAGRRIEDKISRNGPSALDISRPELRTQAVTATLDASLSLLPEDQLQRYVELCIFPEDAAVPVSVIADLWSSTAGLDVDAAESLCMELADLSLVGLAGAAETTLRIHDVIRSFLRRRAAERIADINALWLNSTARILDKTPSPLFADTEFRHDPPPWWNLPIEHYLWDELGYHLTEAGRMAELNSLFSDLRWVCSKLVARGPTAVDADFALVPYSTPIGELRNEVAQTAHLLARVEPEYSLISILLSRVKASDQTRMLETAARFPRLVPERLLPDRPGPEMRRVLTGHIGSIWSTVIDPSGTFLVSAGAGGQARVWDVAKGVLRYKVQASEYTVYTVSISADSSWFVTGGHDGAVRVWELQTGRLRLDLARPGGGIVYGSSINSDSTWLAVCGDHGLIEVWDAITGQLIRRISEFNSTLNACQFLPGDTSLLTVGDDGSVRVWDLETGTVMVEVNINSGAMYACAVNAADQLVIVVGSDGVLRVLDLRSLEQVISFQVTGGAVYDFCASPDGEWIATICEDRCIRIWDSGTGRLRQELVGHLGNLLCCAVSSDGSWMVSGDIERTLRVWDLRVEGIAASRGGERSSSSLSACSASADGNRVIVSGSDGKSFLMDLALDRTQEFSNEKRQIEKIAISPDGLRIATAGELGRIAVWNIQDGSLERQIQAHDGWSLGCAFDPSGNLLFTAGTDAKIRSWDLNTGEMTHEFAGSTGAATCCTASPDGAFLAAGGYDGVLYVWDRNAGELIHALSLGVISWIYDCVWDSNSTMIFAASEDGNVYAWNSLSGMLQATLKGHVGAVLSCSYSATWEYLATCGADNTLRIWNPRSSAPVLAMRVERELSSITWVGETDVLLMVGSSGSYLFRYIPESPVVEDEQRGTH